MQCGYGILACSKLYQLRTLAECKQLETTTIIACPYVAFCVALTKFTKQPISVTIRASDVNKLAMSCEAAEVGTAIPLGKVYQYFDGCWIWSSHRVVDIAYHQTDI